MTGAVDITAADARKKRWAIFVDKHVAPIGDLIEHERSPTCVCHPREEEQEDGSFIFVHHAIDERPA